MQEATGMYKRWQDKQLYLLGRLLLIKGLEMFNIDLACLNPLRFNEYGKPYLVEKLDFNLAHSGNYVVCACSSRLKVGIDIEMIRPINFYFFKSIFTETEWINMVNGESPLTKFFSYWTCKESVAKAKGLGLSIPFKKIEVKTRHLVKADKESWFVSKLDIDHNYCASLATNRPVKNINLQFVGIDDF